MLRASDATRSQALEYSMWIAKLKQARVVSEKEEELQTFRRTHEQITHRWIKVNATPAAEPSLPSSGARQEGRAGAASDATG